MEDKIAKPHIGIMLLESFPDDIEEDVARSLARPDLDLKFHRRAGGPYAGLELYLPTAVVLYIAGAYFSGFLSKAGEDHYDALKNAALSLWKRATASRVTLYGRGKPKPLQKFSFAYSVVGEIASGISFSSLSKRRSPPATQNESYQIF